MKRIPPTDWQAEYLTLAANLSFEKETAVFCPQLGKVVITPGSVVADAFNPKTPGTITMTHHDGHLLAHVYPLSQVARRRFGGLMLNFEMR